MFELSFSCLNLREYEEAMGYFATLARDNDWSKGYYTYMRALCEAKLGLAAQAEASIKEVPKLLTKSKKINGKQVPIDRFVARKTQQYGADAGRRRALPLLEMAYVWNGFSQSPPDILQLNLDEAMEWQRENPADGRSKSPTPPTLATENLLENTDGVPRRCSSTCSLGAAACCLLFMLTRAVLMPSLFQRRPRRASHRHVDHWRVAQPASQRRGGGGVLRKGGSRPEEGGQGNLDLPVRAVRTSIYWVAPRICSKTLMGFRAPHQCSLGAAACYLSIYADGRSSDDVIAF